MDERKRKLQEIRDKARKASENNEEVASEATEVDKKIKFRNYHPYDSTLLRNEIKGNGQTKENHGDNDSNRKMERPPSTVEKDIIQLELEKHINVELNIMPKKPNWDLKNQVEAKMLKLKNRTQKAIVEILREKLSADIDE